MFAGMSIKPISASSVKHSLVAEKGKGLFSSGEPWRMVAILGVDNAGVEGPRLGWIHILIHK